MFDSALLLMIGIRLLIDYGIRTVSDVAKVQGKNCG